MSKTVLIAIYFIIGTWLVPLFLILGTELVKVWSSRKQKNLTKED